MRSHASSLPSARLRALGAVSLAFVAFLATGAPAQAVPNDNCSGAIPVVDGLNGPFDNIGAANGPVNASCGFGGAGGSRDVWFSYVSTCNATLIISTCDTLGGTTTLGDTILSAYATCGGAEIACNDDAGCGPTGYLSTISFPTAAGTLYRIRVASYSPSATGSFSITISCSGVPSNDNCAAAIPVVDGLNGPFDNTGATNSAAAASCGYNGSPGYNDVWFSYTATCTGTVLVDTCDTGGGTTTLDDTILTAYATCGGAELSCSEDTCALLSAIPFPVTSGQTYRIRVSSYASGGLGTFMLTVTCGGTVDFGDAPAATAGLVSHANSGSDERLGAAVTTEGSPLPAWFGDGGDDGIVSAIDLFPTSLNATIVVSASNPSGTFVDYVGLWYRRSGVGQAFDIGLDAVGALTGPVGPAPTTFTFGPFPTFGDSPPSPYVRLRLSRDPVDMSAPTGAGSLGEVEDYILVGSGGINTTALSGLGYSDAGDAPLPYPPAAARALVSERLGAASDGDPNSPVGFPTAGAAAWNDDGADDDGIVRIDGLTPGGSATVTVFGIDPAGTFTDAFSVWMDFDGDGNWDEPGEAFAPVFEDIGPAGSNITLGPLAVPASAVDPVPTRIKMNYYGGESSEAYTAAGASASYGEIEDYLLHLQRGAPCNSGGGGAPAAWADDPPRVGLPFTWRMAGLVPSAPALFVIDVGFLPPIDLALLGAPVAPGICFLRVFPTILASTGPADPAGNLAVTIPVPPDPTLVGATVYLQNFQFAFAPGLVILGTNFLGFTIIPA
jgi:GEVED domain-containing protein